MPANPNPLQPYSDKLAELNTRMAECNAQTLELAKQHKAAVRREEDLRQQYDKLHAELTQLGIMQLGRRMRLRAEQDSISKKIVANQQLQASLLAKQEGCAQRLAVLQEQLGAMQQTAAQEPVSAQPAPVKAVPVEEPAAQAAPVTPDGELPAVQAAPVEQPAASPAEPVRRAPRSAAPRKPVARKARQDGQPEPPLEEAVAHLLSRLEPLYPEHQVYALDSLNADLRDRLGTLTARSGAASPAEFLSAHGWQLITPREALALRRGKHCVPGEEPEIIRPRLESVLSRLEKHYPDHVISRSIQHDHKSLAQDVSGLHLWLGYESIGSMLTAYGFRYDVPVGGRPATDVAGLLDTLRAAYAEGSKPRSIARIAADHPELAGALKTLQNQAPTRFGMSLRQYLAQEGVLAVRKD